MKVSQSEIEDKVNSSLEIYLANEAKRNEKLQLFHGSCEKDGEPDYELLRKHIEIWAQRHPEDMAGFLEYRHHQLENNYKDNGGSDSLDMRNLGAMPPGLYALLCILSPNFLGANEISPESRNKRARTFYQKFPVFRMCKKL